MIRGLGPAPVHEARLPPTSLDSRARVWRICPRLTLLIACCGAPEPASAQEQGHSATFTKDVRHSALTAAPGTLELGVFSYGRYAVNERLELALHPVGFFVWPGVDAKLRWLDVGDFTFSSVHSLSYPTWFLRGVARDGTGGLIDPTQSVAHAVQVDVAALATWRLGPWSWATLQPLAQFRIGEALPLLEFPFLYQRLAATHAGWALGVNASLEGVIGQVVGYEFSATYTDLPLPSVPGAFSVEALTELRWLITDDSTIPIGVRFAHARFPYGRRSHWLPYIDYRIVW